MEENPAYKDSTNLSGMSIAEAREYILGFITTLKLTEKEILSREDVAAKWQRRIELARFQKRDDLLAEAESEAGKVDEKLSELREERRVLDESIAAMRRQIPFLAARDRSVDADILEQELLMALGRTGDDAGTESAFKKLEKNVGADTALEALKARMKGDNP